MNRLRGIIFVIILTSICAANFERPWKNQSWVVNNQNIWDYGFEYWWNLPQFDRTMDSLNYEHSDEIPIKSNTRDAIERAAQYKNITKNNEQNCINNLISSLGQLSFGPTDSFIAAFSSASGCVQYHYSWISAVDSTLLAIEDSAIESDQAIQSFRNAFMEIKFMGICNPDYSGPGSENCSELENAFSSVNITEGNYGKYALFKKYSLKLSENLVLPVPDISLSKTMLELVWGKDGIIEQVNFTKQMVSDAKDNAEKEYRSHLESTKSRKLRAANTLKALDDQDVDLINRGLEGTGEQPFGSISEQFEKLSAKYSNISESFSEATLEHERVMKQNYLANSINSIANADEEYFTLISKISELQKDGSEAVEQQKNEAQNEIAETENHFRSSTPSQESIDILAQANNSIILGERSRTLGKSFGYYLNAAKLARMARAKNYSEKLTVRTSLTTLRDMISRAEIDGIDTVSEKEGLVLLQNLTYPPDILIQQTIDSLISKARIKYENSILTKRKRVYDKLSLAGLDAADLYTDLNRYETGLFQDDKIDFRIAIGSLKKLDMNYNQIEKTIDSYMSQIVGNTMSTSAAPLITNVKLDAQAQIILDVVLTNNKPYNGSHVPARITTPTTISFVYSDIVFGKENVENMHLEDGGKAVIISFSTVKEYETKRIIFEKNITIAHTLKRQTEADGIGNGIAYVSKKIEFELDSDVNNLGLPDDFGNIVIDGNSIMGASSGPIAAGKHILTSDQVVDEAYKEIKENIHVYSIGTNSRVEYDIKLTPSFDMSSAVVYLDSINSSAITSFDVVSATGELVKEKARLSNTQYLVKILGLKKDRSTILKVGYNVENTETLVTDQLNKLGQLNLSAGANVILQEAKNQAASGNYTKALELVEKTLKQSETDEKQEVKIRNQHDQIRTKIMTEVNEIDELVSKANSSTPFIQKITTRENELKKILDELNDTNSTSLNITISNFDETWLDKELVSFKKDAYKQYNDLKQKFYLAGNSTTPIEFIDFETALNKLDSSGKLTYVNDVLSSLENIRQQVKLQEQILDSTKADAKTIFERMKSDALAVLDRYTKTASIAKGTDYSGMFTESDKTVNRLIKEAETAIGLDSRIFLAKIDELNKTTQKMEQTLDNLKETSISKVSLLESLLAQSTLDTEKKQIFSEQINSIKQLIETGDYVSALRASTTLAKDLEAKKPTDNNLLILGVLALVIFGGVGFYLIQKEPKKKLRKLSNSEEATANVSELLDRQ